MCRHCRENLTSMLLLRRPNVVVQRNLHSKRVFNPYVNSFKNEFSLFQLHFPSVWLKMTFSYARVRMRISCFYTMMHYHKS